ncbi:MAG: prolyl oligopeptidase family serine peptidase [Rubricoccaceae bacterium]|nr:prolyl oligopeptidase family serine peptidase [Rubricoccaceae bacterium]
MRHHSVALSFLLLTTPLAIAQQPVLTVDMIMQDPNTWIGAWPTDVFWTDNPEWLYFRWNPQGQFESDSLFKVNADGGEAVQLIPDERRNMLPRFQGWHADRFAYNEDFSKRVFERDGDLFMYDLGTRETARITNTSTRESNPQFSLYGHVVYQEDNNLFARGPVEIEQLTDIRDGNEPSESEPSEREAFLENQQTRLFDTLRDRARLDSLSAAAEDRDEQAADTPPTFFLGDKDLGQLQISPAGRWVTFTLREDEETTRTLLANYVTSSGYAEEINARPKVGDSSAGEQTFYVQDLERDTTYVVDLTTLPGAFDAAGYQREQGMETDSTRTLFAFGPYWSHDGQLAVLDVRSSDNKHRWIARLNPEQGTVHSLDHQVDDAWIAGPGISWWSGTSDVGWLPDNRRFWFQSERSGHSHLYAVDVPAGDVQQLTSGAFEVFDPQLSRDGLTWYFQSSEGSPHERHVYRMNHDGGERTRLTRLTGRNDFQLSPDERLLALMYSQSNRPPEVILEPAAPITQEGRQAPVRYITSSPTEEWLAYSWRDPEIIHVAASDGIEVPARIYRPENPNGAAVLFVHGAGYLQNVHRWWSSYFREYQFHNLLADRGYLVLDLDFRASSGYGRDWRTAVYRHMGGRDLQDYVDASRFVREEFGIEPENVGIYGGSYGGFITLMALFTEAEHFGAGAALRSVTDWAHYNHTYTSNILNTPVEDPVAYERSSPIEFAEGLEDPLLMAHGLIDDNVQPQDIFRLTQRLIELRKENWELAMYPVEPHGFNEPTSWADEYRRILKLFEDNIRPDQ